jgi:hypothetical protein
MERFSVFALSFYTVEDNPVSALVCNLSSTFGYDG